MAVAAVVATMKEAHWLRCWWMSESSPSLFSVVAFRKLTGVNQQRWSWETENQKDRWLDSIFQALFFFFFLPLQCTRIAPFDHDDETTNKWEKGVHSLLSSSLFWPSKSPNCFDLFCCDEQQTGIASYFNTPLEQTLRRKRREWECLHQFHS